MAVRTTFEARPAGDGQWAVWRVKSSDLWPKPDERMAFGPPRYPDLDETMAKRMAAKLAEMEARR